MMMELVLNCELDMAVASRSCFTFRGTIALSLSAARIRRQNFSA